jgi:metal iron transporter
MNCPSRNDDTIEHPDWNQSPSSLTADLTTRADLNGISNLREMHDSTDLMQQGEGQSESEMGPDKIGRGHPSPALDQKGMESGKINVSSLTLEPGIGGSAGMVGVLNLLNFRARRLRAILIKYAKFIGPGFLIAVAYIDPGNYATDVNGG